MIVSAGSECPLSGILCWDKETNALGKSASVCERGLPISHATPCAFASPARMLRLNGTDIAGALQVDAIATERKVWKE
jgi:hypothetical protein